MADLLLYTRQGCCLCEGLAEKLLALLPPPHLRLIDVDGDPDLQRRFGLEVPVLARALPAGEQRLPRVPPRLAGEQLQRWLMAHGVALE
jgi:hypothetical protein